MHESPASLFPAPAPPQQPHCSRRPDKAQPHPAWAGQGMADALRLSALRRLVFSVTSVPSVAKKQGMRFAYPPYDWASSGGRGPPYGCYAWASSGGRGPPYGCGNP